MKSSFQAKKDFKQHLKISFFGSIVLILIWFITDVLVKLISKINYDLGIVLFALRTFFFAIVWVLICLKVMKITRNKVKKFHADLSALFIVIFTIGIPRLIDILLNLNSLKNILSIIINGPGLIELIIPFAVAMFYTKSLKKKK